MLKASRRGAAHLSLVSEVEALPGPKWGAAIREYTTSLSAAGRSKGTITQYRHYLDRVRSDIGGDPWDVSIADLERLLANPRWGPSARKSLRTTLSGFYRWGHRRGYISRDLASELPGVRVPRGVPRPAPEDVIAAALVAAGERERLMLRLAAFGGLRAAEIAQVHRDDLVGDVLVVHGKGSKERVVPLDDRELLVAIATADGFLFPSPYRNGTGHLTANHVSKLVAALLPGVWTAHTLRHRFGTQSFAGTRDLLAVSGLLGHASTVTTQTYVQLPMDNLRAAVAAASAANSAPLNAA